MDDPTAEQNESNNEEGQESQNTAIGETPSSLRPSAAGRQPPSEPEISDASPATSTAAPQQDSSQDFASTENSTTPQILAATTTAAAPSQVAAAVPSTRASLVTSTTPYLKRKDVYIKPESELPEDVELQLARSFLLQNSEKSDMNLYDHLTLTVMRVLETRPRNPVDIFESISGEIKRSKFRTVDPTSSIFKPAYDSAPEIKISKEQMALYEQPSQEDPPEEGLGEIPDIMDLSNLWEWAGVSFGREETFMLFLSLRKLVAEKPLKSVRLWGKIYGLSANYIITEGELKDGVDDEDGNIANGILPEGSEGGAEGDAAVAAEGEAVDPETVAAAAADEASIPKPKVKIIPPLPRENRTGVNRYVYYVCSYPGALWIRLPDVIPEKLQTARKIRKYFTGDLNTQIISYPKFEGNEAQYLRCQIARISGATVVSPAGYYTFDPEDEANEEEGHQPAIIINPEYEGLPNDALLTLSNWVHHVPYILPQGRVTWENPFAALAKPDAEDGDGGDDEDEKEDDNAGGGSGGDDGEDQQALEPETGPPLLTPLSSNDETGDGGGGGPAWVTRPCSTLSPVKFTPVTLRSTRWPGAIVVAYNDKFANLYVGDGHGDVGKGMALADGMMLPPVLPDVAKEFVLVEKQENPDDPDNPVLKEIIFAEQKDPSVAEEEAFEEAKRAKEEEAQEAAEEREEEEPAEED